MVHFQYDLHVHVLLQLLFCLHFSKYVISGITKSIPNISSSGNASPQSTTISFSYSNTVIFFLDFYYLIFFRTIISFYFYIHLFLSPHAIQLYALYYFLLVCQFLYTAYISISIILFVFLFVVYYIYATNRRFLCMKEKTFDGLTIRKLKTKDAANFAKISNGLGMAQYLSYFRAKNVSEAENIIVKNNRNGYAMYGLFVRRIGLVSVFMCHRLTLLVVLKSVTLLVRITLVMIMLHVVFSFWLKLLAKTFLILLLLLKRKMMPVLLCKVNSVLREFSSSTVSVSAFSLQFLTGWPYGKKWARLPIPCLLSFFYIFIFYIFPM